jgi:hypothetical protein
MSYDEEVAERLRKVVGTRSGVTEKKMFGGLAFLLNGHMFCGIIKKDLMVNRLPQRNLAGHQAHVRLDIVCSGMRSSGRVRHEAKL